MQWPSRQIEKCPYRETDGSDNGDTAKCRLLQILSSVKDPSLITVERRACEACSRDLPPSPYNLNPPVASLLYRLGQRVRDVGGVGECDLVKARELENWALQNISLTRAGSPQRAEGVAGIPINRHTTKQPCLMWKRLSDRWSTWQRNSQAVCRDHANARAGACRCIRMLRPMDHGVGWGVHRSGWPNALRSLQPLWCRYGIWLDDFVEQSFCFSRPKLVKPRPRTEAWIGIFHQPPSVPVFASRSYLPFEAMLTTPAWRRSAKHLRGAIALSRHLAEYLSQFLDVPIVSVKHPSEIPNQTWSEADYLQKRPRTLVQLGWHLRNTRAIYQLPPLPTYRKIRLLPDIAPIREYDEQVFRYWAHQSTRREYGGVIERGYLLPDEYDVLLASGVALTEVIDASANNVVLECVARNTPLVVNRHPAVVEYLTAEYPLYFDDLADVPDLLTTERVVVAHRYLAEMDKKWLSGQSFRESIRAAVAAFSAV